jgi:hypothetical protein
MGRGTRRWWRRFHALADKVTLVAVGEHGVARLPGELRGRRYRPVPARRVLMPKPGGDEIRPLSIPAVRDRIVRAALKILLELVFEADFLPCSFGFRTAVPACVALRSDRCEGWSPRINR